MDNKPDEKPVDKPQDLPIGAEVRGKTFSQILAEKAEPTKPTDEPTKPDEPKGPTPEEIQKQQEERSEALARRAADEALKARDEAEKKARDEAKAKEDAKPKEPKQPKWKTDPNAPKDEKGNPIPSSYDEIYEEAKNAAKEEALAEFEARQTARQQEEAAKTEEAKRQQDEAAKAQDAQAQQLNKRIEDDVNDLYATGKLPKIVDPKDDRTDKDGLFLEPGKRAQQLLFMQGVKVNQERVTKGLAPIDSIKLIYYEHYTPPTQQPAGADAPVQKNSQPPKPDARDEKYNWAKDHKKTPREMLQEARARALGRG